MGQNQLLGGGHLLETSSRGARKSCGSKAKFGHAGQSVGSLSLRGLASGSFFQRLSAFDTTRAISGALGAAVALLLTAFLFPALPEAAQAVEETNPGISTYASDPTASINLPSTIDFADVLPTAAGVTTTASASLTITTSNSGGYSLYFYSSNGNNSLTPINPNNSSSISSTPTTTELNNLNNNTWGYNLSTEASTSNTTTYSAIPTNNTTPVQTKDTSTTNSANDTYTLFLGAKVDNTIPSGVYSNDLVVAVVAEPAMITIAFNGNGSTSGNMPSVKIPAGDSQVLPDNSFTRSGYGFTGWNTAANGGGTSYSDGATLTTTTAQAGQTITLYAQWMELVNLLDDVTYMQDLTAAQCSGSSDGVTATLVDRRDNNSYTIAKFNGACWMTQNLRLSGGRTLTPSNSNVTRNWNFPNNSIKSDDTNYIGNSYTEAGFTIDSNTFYGGYYNYCAASAGTVCSDSSSQDATQDICPKGWELPTLDQFEGIDGTSYLSAFSHVLSGYYYHGWLYETDYRGYWWSATGFGIDGTNQHLLGYYNGSLNVYGGTKRHGYSVRCVRSS